MWHELVVAVALLLVVEGALPFLNPEAVRRALLKISTMSDSTMRFAGLTSMVAGCLMLYVVR